MRSMARRHTCDDCGRQHDEDILCPDLDTEDLTDVSDDDADVTSLTGEFEAVGDTA